jgi:predicted RNase H-like HicB family nuclease
MTTYNLYLESGPQRRKTMVHVFDLLGCVATGPTTEAAVADTPETIRAYLRFLARHGEEIDLPAPFQTRIVQHVTEGGWLGNGSPYVIFEPDLEPLTDAEIETYLRRFRWLSEELAGLAAPLDGAALDALPAEGGRPARRIFLHVLAPIGGYLSAALGGAKGFSAAAGAAERGQLSLVDALMRVQALAEDQVRSVTPEERAAVRERPNGERRTLRKALRRMLEHDWEHLAELQRRPGMAPR